MPDKVYLPKQETNRGKAGYKNLEDHMVVVDAKEYRKSHPEEAQKPVGSRGRKADKSTDESSDSNEE